MQAFAKEKMIEMIEMICMEFGGTCPVDGIVRRNLSEREADAIVRFVCALSEVHTPDTADIMIDKIEKIIDAVVILCAMIIDR